MSQLEVLKAELLQARKNKDEVAKIFFHICFGQSQLKDKPHQTSSYLIFIKHI